MVGKRLWIKSGQCRDRWSQDLPLEDSLLAKRPTNDDLHVVTELPMSASCVNAPLKRYQLYDNFYHMSTPVT